MITLSLISTKAIFVKSILLLFFACMILLNCSDRAEAMDLKTGFNNPPQSAKPRVWWHWMKGNITKDGIKKDLEWMGRVGVGGFQNFDAALMTPQIVEQRLTYMTPEWKEAFLFTTKMADSLGLEMAIAGSPGWSESGGPWVAPEDGMKKFVWTETRVKGGTSGIKLDKPSGVTGPFQNISKQAGITGETVDVSKLPVFYKDVAVVAYKLPASNKSLKELGVEVTSSGGDFSLSQLTDGDVATSSLLPSDSETGYAWIQFAFPQAQTIKAVSMVGGGEPGILGMGAAAPDSRKLEASDDGVDFKFVCNIPPGAILQQTMAIPETTAKYFRVKVTNPPPTIDLKASLMGAEVTPEPSPGTEIAEIVLHTADVVNRFEEKSAFAPVGDLYAKWSCDADDVVGADNIVDLTGKMNPDGSLNWTAPDGDWKVVRFGYSLLGIENHPASPEATGPEVDKLDPDAVKKYFTNYLDQYKSATGGLMGDKGGLQFMITDSWEAGAQNWTADLPREFRKRRGYSIIPWIPVLTGAIVKSAEASEQFLFDFRKTLSDMVAEYHYDGLTGILKEYGMKRYSESHENGRAMIADGMEVKRTAAIPMSAMWTPNMIINKNNQTFHEADIRESASVAHIYGQNLVAAESLTAYGIDGSAWSYSPENLKSTADLELASGLNRFVIHTSVHQPVDDKIPGLGLGPFGQWFTRHETWAEQAGAWIDYLSRSSCLLQQGKFVADIVYYYGEDNNITSLFREKLPDIPEGYSYDFVNADALTNVLSANEGLITTPGGMQYKILALDENSRYMTLPVLRKIRELVGSGAVVSGSRPLKTPSLSDDADEFNTIVNELWPVEKRVNPIGKGKVYIGQSLEDVLNDLNIQADFQYTKPDESTKLLFVHRKLSDADIYWVNNRNNRVENLEATFRIDGKSAEIWHPETGKTETASYFISEGKTKVPLTLVPDDAVFVVFRNKTNQESFEAPTTVETQLETISGDWKANFQSDRGAPQNAIFNELTPWNENENPGIKYFSGTAEYTKAITIPEEWINSDAELWLDLGEVKNLAEVSVNGDSFGIVWKKPFKVNIDGALQPGENQLSIKVTNLWVNRLIGDQQPEAEKITYTTMPFYQADSPLLTSGLLGPVTIKSVTKK